VARAEVKSTGNNGYKGTDNIGYFLALFSMIFLPHLWQGLRLKVLEITDIRELIIFVISTLLITVKCPDCIKLSNSISKSGLCVKQLGGIFFPLIALEYNNNFS
jgi:hypothetical protein